MSRLYSDVPEHLRLSDAPIKTVGDFGGHAGKIPWTPSLVALVWEMYDLGVMWKDIVMMVSDRFGVKVTKDALADYVKKNKEE